MAHTAICHDQSVLHQFNCGLQDERETNCLLAPRFSTTILSSRWPAVVSNAGPHSMSYATLKVRITEFGRTLRAWRSRLFVSVSAGKHDRQWNNGWICETAPRLEESKRLDVHTTVGAGIPPRVSQETVVEAGMQPRVCMRQLARPIFYSPNSAWLR